MCLAFSMAVRVICTGRPTRPGILSRIFPAPGRRGGGAVGIHVRLPVRGRAEAGDGGDLLTVERLDRGQGVQIIQGQRHQAQDAAALSEAFGGLPVFGVGKGEEVFGAVGDFQFADTQAAVGPAENG